MLSCMCMQVCALNRIRRNLLCMKWLLQKPVGVSRLEEMLRENHVPKVVHGKMWCLCLHSGVASNRSLRLSCCRGLHIVVALWLSMPVEWSKLYSKYEINKFSKVYTTIEQNHVLTVTSMLFPFNTSCNLGSMCSGPLTKMCISTTRCRQLRSPGTWE